jgi:hypothetical protein
VLWASRAIPHRNLEDADSTRSVERHHENGVMVDTKRYGVPIEGVRSCFVRSMEVADGTEPSRRMRLMALREQSIELSRVEE